MAEELGHRKGRWAMNFFEHQDRARRNTFRLIGLFAISVVLITIMVNLVVHLCIVGFCSSSQRRLSSYGTLMPETIKDMYTLQAFTHSLWTSDIVRSHALFGVGVMTLIGLASTYRIYQLRGGGDRIATELGGEWVDPETTDPVLRRLVNVVEEISLASGVPMPFVYVLEKESGINALAVGYSFEDAVVVVSRGALRHLDRDELQGVVAHEFTHILNGDMRLNIRMIGVLFGILGVSQIGRHLMYGDNSQNASGDRQLNMHLMSFVMGAAVFCVGYIGVFLGRLIRAGISRQREFLADASAVQFTRNPDGLVGALVKISKMQGGGFVHMVRREEVAHMFFTAGQPFWTQMMATHPPLIDRIRAIKPDYQPDERFAASPGAPYAGSDGNRIGVSAFSPGVTTDSGKPAETVMTAVEAFSAVFLADQDRPDPQHLDAAIRTLSLMPDALLNAARRHDEVEALFPALFVSRSTAFRDRRMLHIWDVLGSETGSRVKRLRLWTDRLAPGHTLPLADLAFPALKALPEASKARLVRLMTDLVKMGRKTSLFEYCFVHLLNHRLDDTRQPSHVGGAGKANPARLREALTTVFSVLAGHGHLSRIKVEQAFEKGIRTVRPKSTPSFIWPKNWPAELDSALDVLNQLNFKSKEKLITALLATATADDVLCLEEAELLRTICACLGVPVPLMLASSLPDPVHQAA